AKFIGLEVISRAPTYHARKERLLTSLAALMNLKALRTSMRLALLFLFTLPSPLPLPEVLPSIPSPQRTEAPNRPPSCNFTSSFGDMIAP
ncbi:UNVERIFIED_CONTAM: hypothetical protein Sindi_2926000, partial [Sesamum indicum]